MMFRLKPLPFDVSALEPHMSRRTLELHYGKHHAGYVEKLNKLIRGTEFEKASLEQIIQGACGREDAASIFNNAGQVWNHDFFWESLKPQGGGQPTGALQHAIESAFGSFDSFRDQFVKSATNHFGSGWTWLAQEGGRLRVLSTHDAENPLVFGQRPLTCCDVWEHAYYLDHENNRERFVRTFLEKLVNWEFAGKQFAMQGEGNLAAGRQYQDEQAKFAQSPERVASKSQEAARALEGEEGKQLEEARRRTAAGPARPN
jgi:Fe-Mn family superoxide dismutase